MSSVTSYGDISPRTAAYAVAQMLKRGLPYLVLEKFGQSLPDAEELDESRQVPPVLPVGCDGCRR